MKRGIMMYAIIILALAIAGCSGNSQADNGPVNGDADNDYFNSIIDENPGKIVVFYFYGDGCPHCRTQKDFFDSIASKYPEMEIYMFETYRNQSNVRLFADISARHGATPRGVPATFIGDKMWIGFAASVGREIEQKLEYCKTNECRIPEI